MRRLVSIALTIACIASAAPDLRASDAPLLGFSSAGAAAERAREAEFDGLLQPEDQRTWMQRLTAHPHHVGSPYDAENARYLLQLLTSFGFDAHIERFEALFPTPVRRQLELVAPTQYTATLREMPLAVDPTTSQTSEQLPPYNAYSRDGT